MRKFLTITLVIILSLCVGTTIFYHQPASAADLNVHPGDSIQDAINAASAGDTIYVDSGTYVENIIWENKDISIIGSGSDDCIIDGNGGLVVKTSGLSVLASLEGFTIQNGTEGGMYNSGSSPSVTNCTFINNSIAGSGGGMRNYLCSPTVTNCTFTSNSAHTTPSPRGGGMYNYKSFPILTNCTFELNSAVHYGGGMFNMRSSPTLTDCTFTENSADQDGGGIANWYSCSPILTDCTFTENSAGKYGGGLYSYDESSPRLTDCTFTENSAGKYGGAIWNTHLSAPTMTNCTFTGNSALWGGAMGNSYSSPTLTNCTFAINSAEYAGSIYNGASSPTLTNCTFNGNSADYCGGIANSAGSLPVVTNCILYGDTLPEITTGGGANVTYSDVEGGYSGTGNINVDPSFVDVTIRDFHLQLDSPCIDAGNNTAPYLPLYDFEGDERIINGRVDMGVDEVITNKTPDVSQAYASPDCIWPANHKMLDITIMGVTDPDEDTVTIIITGITSDEPTASDKGSGGAKHAPDANGVGSNATSVRAERSGTGDGRVYVIHFTAEDDRGGVAEGSVVVKVPRDRSDKTCPAVDSGQLYNATEIN
ncbi:right-handed parallel beta-helix repeat-containing protein [Chloroflexota bacterium]